MRNLWWKKSQIGKKKNVFKHLSDIVSAFINEIIAVTLHLFAKRQNSGNEIQVRITLNPVGTRFITTYLFLCYQRKRFCLPNQYVKDQDFMAYCTRRIWASNFERICCFFLFSEKYIKCWRYFADRNNNSNKMESFIKLENASKTLITIISH